MLLTSEYLSNPAKNFTASSFGLAEQLYLITKRQLILTKVLKLRYEVTTHLKNLEN